MTEDADLQAAEDQAFDEYVAAARRGEVEEVQRFCERHGDRSGRLKKRIEALCWLIDGHRGTASREDPPPFERLGDYRLVRRLGEGGMGVVFLAVQESLGREVALKVIRPERSGSRRAARRFDREVAAVARLQHPNIVTVFGTGEEQGVRYLAMEYVRGLGLDRVLEQAKERGETVPLKRALRIAQQIALALEAAHACGIIHRDVKPSNIWISEWNDSAKLMDFGLARDLGEGDSSLTQGFTGSPSYAAPEQIDAAAGEIGAATDIYALGVTLYELVTGRVPFQGDTTEQLFQLVLLTDPLPPRRHNPGLPRDVETVLFKALEKAPRRRYPSAAEFASDLDAILALRPIAARPASRLHRSLRLIRRHRRASGVIGALLLVLLVGFAMLFAQHRRDSEAFEAEWTAAERFVAAGDIERAFSALDRALAHQPGDSRTLLRRQELELRQNQARIEQALARAGLALDAYRASRKALDRRRAELKPLLESARGRYVGPEQTRMISSVQRAVNAGQRDADEQFFACLAAGRAASLLAGDSPAARELMAELYLEKWRESVAARNHAEALFYQGRVEENDVEGRHTEELRGLGLVSIRSEPAAEAFLFQYLPQSSLIPDGDERLVPVPLGGPSGEVTPGTHALRVVRSEPPLDTNDLVLEIEGHPVEDLVLVAKGQGEIQAFDRLLAIDGIPVRGEDDVIEARHKDGGGRDGQPLVLQFQRDGRTFEVQQSSFGAFGITALSAERLLREVEVDALVYRAGALEELRLPAGLETRLTAAPLLISPDCHIGVTPLIDLSLPPGSYLLLLRAEGCIDQRYPFVLERKGRAEVTVLLEPLEHQRDDFVYVPPGMLATGGDPEAQSAFGEDRLQVAGFWIMDRPVTCSEYLEFLNAPGTREWIRSEREAVGFPRLLSNLQSGGFWPRAADGLYRLDPREADWPVYGISLIDALAYVRFMNARAEASGSQERYGLPTELEWEWAARGADQRAFTFGERFVPLWTDTLFGRPEAHPEPVRSHPIDESPFGVFDQNGAVSEWCDGPPEQEMYPLRSSSWANANATFYRLATRIHAARNHTSPGTGLRLVIRFPGD